MPYKEYISLILTAKSVTRVLVLQLQKQGCNSVLMRLLQCCDIDAEYAEYRISCDIYMCIHVYTLVVIIVDLLTYVRTYVYVPLIHHYKPTSFQLDAIPH